MRVIAGSKKGYLLKTLEGGDVVRPTTDKVKEAVFSSIQFELEHCTFLDLFAGSGQMGIEALSRGAGRACFVDENAKSIDVCRKNLIHTGLIDSGAVIVRSGSERFLLGTDMRFDIAFLDPPYGKDLILKTLPLLAPVMNSCGKIICECSTEEQLPDEIMGFVTDRVRQYGKIKITYYVRQQGCEKGVC